MQHAGDEGLIRNAFLQGTLLKAREVFARDANVDSTIFAERRSGILLVARDLLRLLVNRLPLSILCRLLELTLDFVQLLWHHIISDGTEIPDVRGHRQLLRQIRRDFTASPTGRRRQFRPRCASPPVPQRRVVDRPGQPLMPLADAPAQTNMSGLRRAST